MGKRNIFVLTTLMVFILGIGYHNYGEKQGQAYIRCDAANGGFNIDGGEMIILELGDEINIDVRSDGSIISLWSGGWPDGYRWITNKVYPGDRWKIVWSKPIPRIVMKKTELVDDDSDGIWDDFEEGMAIRFAPEVRLAPDNEDWTRPANVDWYLSQVTMRFDRSFRTDAEIIKPGQVTQANIYRQSYDGYSSNQDCKRFFLQPPDDSVHHGLSSSEDWRVYAHVMKHSGGGYAIQYWFFYAYNDFTASANHEGDWEHITVIVDESGKKFVQVYYRQHEGGMWYSSSNITLLKGTHPVVYSADGSHASYPFAGSFDVSDWPFDDHTYENGPRWETWMNLINIGERGKPLNGQTFILYGGCWGEIGAWRRIGRDETSGPQGPAFKSTWDLKY